MEQDAGTLQLLIQAGAIGITIILIGYIAWRDKMQNDTMQGHFDQDSQAKQALAEAIKEVSNHLAATNANNINMVSTLERNTRALEDNTRLMQRMEGVVTGSR